MKNTKNGQKMTQKVPKTDEKMTKKVRENEKCENSPKMD